MAIANAREDVDDLSRDKPEKPRAHIRRPSLHFASLTSWPTGVSPCRCLCQILYARRIRSQHTCLSCLIQQSRQLPSTSLFTTKRAASSFAGATSTWTFHERTFGGGRQKSDAVAVKAYSSKHGAKTAPRAAGEDAEKRWRVRRLYSSVAVDAVPLTDSETTQQIGALAKLKRRINSSADKSEEGNGLGKDAMTIEKALSIDSRQTPRSMALPPHINESQQRWGVTSLAKRLPS